jgi:hypothetical protein
LPSLALTFFVFNINYEFPLHGKAGTGNPSKGLKILLVTIIRYQDFVSTISALISNQRLLEC